MLTRRKVWFWTIIICILPKGLGQADDPCIYLICVSQSWFGSLARLPLVQSVPRTDPSLCRHIGGTSLVGLIPALDALGLLIVDTFFSVRLGLSLNLFISYLSFNFNLNTDLIWQHLLMYFCQIIWELLLFFLHSFSKSRFKLSLLFETFSGKIQKKARNALLKYFPP